MSRIYSQRNFWKIALAPVCLSLLLVLFAGLLGCGKNGSNDGARAGAISVTDPNGIVPGQLSSLSIGAAAKVSMMPAGDVQNAGVDWSVTCGGSPLTGSLTDGACGSFTTLHTSDGGASIYTAPVNIPSGTVVTLMASATSNPSATSNVTLTIVPLTISVVFTRAPTLATVGTSLYFAANALNDTSGAGVTFTVTNDTGTCGSTACGTFTNVQATTVTYNAPSTVPMNNTVTITATSVADPTKSASVTVTILPAATLGPITVTVTPSSAYAAPSGAAHTIALTATVTNNPANGGVSWTYTCGSPGACGTLTPGSNTNDVIPATYQAPSAVPTGGTVTITATSNTNNSISGTATITITTSTVTVIKFSSTPQSSMAEGATATLTATATPTGQSINWTCAPAGACGSFNPASTTSGKSTVYTAPTAIPSGNTVTITAASASAISNPAVAAITITAPAPTIAFVQQPPAMLTASGVATVSATVANDVAPGGITWTVPLTCGSTTAGGCGSIQPYQTTGSSGTVTYTAPPVVPTGTVTILASSTTTSGVQKLSTPITITASTALSVNFVPAAPAELPSYAVVNLNAAVTNDTTKAGVDWQVCASGCGFFTKVAAVPAIPATATTPYIPAVPAVTAPTVQAWPNGLPISYTAPLATVQGQTVTVTAMAHANNSILTSATIAITSVVGEPTINGVVQAGTLPVVGASVGLYAAGTTGYGSASTLLFAQGRSSYAITDSNGNFTLPGGYSCPQTNSQVYLVATGGSVGTNAGNPNLSLMTALGPCSNLSSGKVFINEVTTIGSVWSLAPFASDDPLTGSESYLNIGTSSTNTTGLANAFAAVNNLVNIATGQPQFAVPAGNGAVPYAEINTLADILNTCTATAGGAYNDGTPCGKLFFDAAPLGLAGRYNGTAPTDTVQAAMNIAQHPFGGSYAFNYNNDISGLYGLVSPASPFQPILSSSPNDFSISINFSAVGGLTGLSGANYFALDAAGDLWITQAKDDSAHNVNRVVEWNNLGAPISSGTGFAAGGITSPGPLAVDASGNIWISGGNGLTELYANGSPVEGSPFANGGGGIAMAIDSLSNIWVTNGTGVAKFNSVGTEVSPVAGYVNSGVTNTGQITIDGSNNVWVSNFSSGSLYLNDLYDSSGVLNVSTTSLHNTDTTQIAADGSGNVFVPTGTAYGEICEVPAYGGLGSIFVSTCYAGTDRNGIYGIYSIYNPSGVAVDGAGAVWFGNLGSSSTSVQPNVTEVVPSFLNSTSISDYVELVSSSLSAGPLKVAIDGAGNIWVLLANNTITEYVGAATPAVTPLALAVKNKKIGAKP